jgi:hypothetical protein
VQTPVAVEKLDLPENRPKRSARNVSEIGENRLQGILMRHIFGGSSASEFFDSYACLRQLTALRNNGCSLSNVTVV